MAAAPYQTHESSINGVLAARLLKHLQHTIDLRLPVIWDGSPIHRNRAVKAVQEQADGRTCLERLPGYAPDLNFDEAVWEHRKNVQLANACRPDLATQRQALRNAIRHFKLQQSHLIPTLFQHAGL